jgi:hypothetical protein
MNENEDKNSLQDTINLMKSLKQADCELPDKKRERRLEKSLGTLIETLTQEEINKIIEETGLDFGCDVKCVAKMAGDITIATRKKTKLARVFAERGVVRKQERMVKECPDRVDHERYALEKASLPVMGEIIVERLQNIAGYENCKFKRDFIDTPNLESRVFDTRLAEVLEELRQKD